MLAARSFGARSLAAKTFIRSFWGAAVVLFTVQMYHRLGDQWASTFVGVYRVGVLCDSVRVLPTGRGDQGPFALCMIWYRY